MWKEPDEEVIIENAAAKLDRAAAARRSAIRREPSVRPSREHSQPISVLLRNRNTNSTRSRDRLRQEERDTDSHIARLQNELERLRNSRMRGQARLNNELEIARAGRDLLHSSASPDRLNSEQNLEGNSDGTGTAVDASQHLPRPPRESNLRFEFLPSNISRSSSPWRYQVLSRTTMPSPPHSSGSDLRDRSIPDGPVSDGTWPIDERRMPALTEGFAPARAANRSASQHHDSQRPDDDIPGLETPPPEAWEASYPPLHRVSHSSPRPFPRVDGLGDRRRSLSPFSDLNEEETWMTNLLATIDTHSSSATSFASTNSEAIRRSQNSSQATSTSFGEIGSADETCDLDLPEGITEEDVRMIRERYRRPRNRDRMTGLRGMQEQLERIGATEYGMFQAILERMQRREPVPDDWWTTIGLSPDFGRNP